MASILVNATPVAVTYRDGKTETIELGELTIRQLHRFAERLGANDSPGMVAMCAGKPEAWIDTLTDESFAQLCQTSFNLNFLRAVGMWRSDPIVNAKLTPILLEFARNEGLIEESGLRGKTLSPEPATTASAEATGSGSST